MSIKIGSIDKLHCHAFYKESRLYAGATAWKAVGRLQGRYARSSLGTTYMYIYMYMYNIFTYELNNSEKANHSKYGHVHAFFIITT